jgi:hypothetical protein
MEARRQLLPANSPLEQGDRLYERGRLIEALSAFEHQAKELGMSSSAQEARYKAALCLLGLDRTDEAAVLLERLAGESGERWPPAAACRLWLLLLHQGRSDDADTVFNTLAARYRLPELLGLFPDEERRDIMAYYHSTWDGNQLLYNPRLTARLEFAVQVGDFLGVEPRQRTIMVQTLVRGNVIAGHRERAVEIARAAISTAGAAAAERAPRRRHQPRQRLCLAPPPPGKDR